MQKSMGKVWVDRIKVVIISALFASVANMIYTWRLPAFETTVMPWEVFPALGLMMALVFFSCIIHDVLELIPFVKKIQIPIILYIALFTTLISFPGIGGGIATFMQVEFAKINLLPLCTPILAYAGIAVGKDMKTFKQQGLAIVLVALFTFAGTYLGSALIAQLLLQSGGVIL